MKEIGEKLKAAREEMGISIEEVSEDLKMRPNQIEAIENGNMEAFKDIYNLKYLVKDYAKYLGLNYEDIIDDFNEYMFDYTSKISVEDIKEAKKSLKEDKNIMHSPYTVEHSNKKKSKIIIVIVIVIIALIASYFVYQNYFVKDNSIETAIIE